MQLSSIIERAIELNTKAGTTDSKKASDAATATTLADSDATAEAVSYCVTKMVRDRATKTLRGAGKDPRQASFFGDELFSRYAIANTGVIKDTECLTQLEWTTLLQFRRKQVADDTVRLRAMEAANRQLSPIWNEYPDKTYGEIEAIYLRRREAAE
jgi:hypothetical protein